ncbi:hypothetical protein Ccrd_002256 [Cynara cardunculus var. scolymus]|uniref:Uncharacterized protein n=1 Tax=Cynara cardunculus var. scolymus TaxID=59895 RepID=A0A103XRS3_CYNCS|nr:hypothetical protein Ccrd_002256 [Cynara cardunculus var. scolymus]
MEEYNDLEQVTGSPTSGESGFVHVEPIDSASIDGSPINQDDGVVVTSIDTVQYESSDIRMAEDGGNEEFVDCPDDLVSYDGMTSFVESSEGEVVPENQQTFRDDTEDNRHGFSDERRRLMIELTNLHHQLRDLIENQPLIGGNDGGLSTDQFTSATGVGDDKSFLPLHEMINDCSRFIQLALSKQSQTEVTIRELYSTLDAKDREIEDLNVKVTKHNVPQLSSVETIADRILSSIATVVGGEEFPDTSVSGKLSHLEKSTSLLIEKYNHFLSEVEMLNQCLAEIKSEYHMQTDMDKVLFTVREELIESKRKELELANRSSHLEDEYRKLMEQVDKGRKTIEMLYSEIGKLKGEVEVEKARFSNAKEKLGLAVTRGKSLVQQRDSLRQVIVEKTNELDKCLIELQEKSSALEAAELRKEEMEHAEALANSLKQALLQRDMILEKCEEVLSLSGAAEELQSSDIIDKVTWLSNERSRLALVSLEFQKLTNALSSLELPEVAQYTDLGSQVSWLLESFNMAKSQSSKLQEEINTMKEGTCAEIDRLTLLLLVEAQEKSYLEDEFEDLTHEYKEVVKEKCQVFLEKEQMLTLLLDASGISRDGLEDSIKLHSDIAMVIDRCLSRIKENAIGSYEPSPMKTELLEKFMDLLYEKDQACKLYEQILEEETVDKLELDKCLNKIAKLSEELHVLKDKNGSLQIDLQRSEDKAMLLREKLSMAVKKGKSLVQERESMKQQMAEKNTQIEALKQELKQQEATINDCRDKISKLSSDVEQITKLESDLLCSKEERDQIEQFLVESNTILQRVIEAIDCIVLPVDLTDPVEKVKWCAAYLNECQVAKAQAEQELGDVKDEASMLTSKLTDALTTVKSLEDALLTSEKSVSQLTEEKRESEMLRTHIEEELHKAMEEWKISKTRAEQEAGVLQEEVATLNNKLMEVLTNLKTLEDVQSGSVKMITQLTEEKRELEVAKSCVEQDLHKALEDASSQMSKFQEIIASKNSLQEELSLAEKNISAVRSEKEDAQASTVASERELQKIKEEVSTHVINLDEAYRTIRSLEDAMSQSQTDVSQFSNENEKARDNVSLLESEIKKLKEEIAHHERMFADASATIKTLEDELLKAKNHISDVVGEQKIAEQEILTLNTQLSGCRQELACKHDFELPSFLDNLQVILKDGTLLTLFKQSFEKKIEIFIEMDRHLKDIMDCFDSEQLKDYPAIELSTFLPAGFENVLNTEIDAPDAEDIGSFAGNFLEKFILRNQILADEFGRLSTSTNDLTTSLLIKLDAIRNTVPFMVEHTKTLQKNVNNLHIDKQAQEDRVVVLEHDIKVLLSACADVTEEMKNLVENNILEIDSAHGLDKLNSNPSSNIREIVIDNEALADVKVAEEMLSAARNVQSVIEHCVDVKQKMTTTITKLQAELEKTRSMYDKAKEENDIFQNKVSKLEPKLAASPNLHYEMGIKLEDSQPKEDDWNEREAELSKQTTAFIEDHEAQNDLLSASEIKSLFDKVNGITIPFPNAGAGDIQPHDLDPTKKLFYIVDSVNELLDQITLLSNAKEELQSTLSRQALEIEHLEEEFDEALKDKDSDKIKELFELSIGLESIISKFGGDESIGGKKSGDVAALLPVLERLVQSMVLDGENTKMEAQDLGVKLLETQKVVEELASKVKLLEDLNQSRIDSPDTIHEKGITEASALPPRSEISEVQDLGPIGKRSMPSAAHVRTLKKGSNDHLSINIDQESDRLIDTRETVEDKRLIFKSLHTTGLVPAQGKIIADRLDGIWVSGGQALMSRPRARLGLIAYWLVLHLWLLGTLL